MGCAIQFENLGTLFAERAELEKADEMLSQAVGLNREMDTRYGLAGSLRERGRVRLKVGRVKPGREDLEESVRLFADMSLQGKVDETQGVLAKLDS